MRRLFLLIALFIPSLAAAQVGSFQQWCQAGGQFSVVSGITATTPVQASYPQCQVEVFFTGTATPASITVGSPTGPVSNPFCANADASFLFFAAISAQYDVVLSNASACNPPPFAQLPASFTFSDIAVSGSGGGGGGSGTVTHNIGNLVTGAPVVGSGPGDIYSSGAYLFASRFSGIDGCAQVLAAETQSVTNAIGQSVVVDIGGNIECQENPNNPSFAGNLIFLNGQTIWLSSTSIVLPTRMIMYGVGDETGNNNTIIKACSAVVAGYCPAIFPTNTPLLCLINCSTSATAQGYSTQVWNTTADCSGIAGCTGFQNYYANENSGFNYVTAANWCNNGRGVAIGKSTGSGSGGNTILQALNLINTTPGGVPYCQGGAAGLWVNGVSIHGPTPKKVDSVTVVNTIASSQYTTNGYIGWPDYDVQLVGAGLSIPGAMHEESFQYAGVGIGGVETGLGGQVTPVITGGGVSGCNVTNAGIGYARSGTVNFLVYGCTGSLSPCTTPDATGSVNVTFSGGSITACAKNVTGSGYGTNPVMVSIDDVVTLGGASAVTLATNNACCAPAATTNDVIRIFNGAQIQSINLFATQANGPNIPDNTINDQNHLPIASSLFPTVGAYQINDASLDGSVFLDSSQTNTNNLGATGFGTNPATACGSAIGCIAQNQGSTAGTPTTVQNYFRATPGGWVCSVGGSAEASCINSGIPAPGSAQIADTLLYNIYGDGNWDAGNHSQSLTFLYPQWGGQNTLVGPMSGGLSTIGGHSSVTPTASVGPGDEYTAASVSASTNTIIGMTAGSNGSNSVEGMLTFYRWTQKIQFSTCTSARYWMGLSSLDNSGTGNNNLNPVNSVAYATNTPNKTTLGFRFSAGTDSFWQIVSINAGSSGGSQTTIATTVACDTNIHTYEMAPNALGTQVNFFIDGALVGNITTNLPNPSLGANSFGNWFWSGDNENTTTATAISGTLYNFVISHK